MSSEASQAKPIGVGLVANEGSTLSVQIGLGKFVSPMDIYVAYSIPDDPDKIYILNPDYSVTPYALSDVLQAMSENHLPAGVEAWKQGTTGLIDEIIMKNIPVSEITQGTYAYYLLASPAGALDRYYLWGTATEVEGDTLDKEQQQMPEPFGRLEYFNEAGAYPAVSSEASKAKPIGVGTVADGGSRVSIQIGLGKFVNPMDIYVAYSIPDDPDRVYIMNADHSVTPYALSDVLQAMSENHFPAGVEAWKQGSTGMINEIILKNIPVSEINQGTYAYYLLASPAGALDRYYLWGTEFDAEGGSGNSAMQLTPAAEVMDGIALYNANCSICHGGFNSSSKAQRNVEQIQSAIANVGMMKGLGNLRGQQIAAIAGSLATIVPPPSPTPPVPTPPVPTPPPTTITTTNGRILYETLCVGCHGPLAKSAKAGATAARIQNAINSNAGGMGMASISGLTAVQVNAIANALAAVTPPPPPATNDGATLYANSCQSCHGPLATSTKKGRTAAQIQASINSVGAMNSLMNLTAAQVSAIAGVLATTTPPPPPPVVTDGATLYTSNCSGCHGPLATSSKRGRTA
ncbi:MAG: cytochrome c, partial [Nitrospirae bacterium]